ncbi:MAG: hypothetical protein K0U98_06010 [Deltaproteobacteria bacterium]|nr:hypothetical protein [Deltaproteobacteria bacterium]
MRYLSAGSVLQCSHGGQADLSGLQSGVTVGGQRVLTEKELKTAPLIGCPQIGPGLKPCTKVNQVVFGKAAQVKFEGGTPLLATLVAITDGSPPGICQVVSDGGSCASLYRPAPDAKPASTPPFHSLTGGGEEERTGSETDDRKARKREVRISLTLDRTFDRGSSRTDLVGRLPPEILVEVRVFRKGMPQPDVLWGYLPLDRTAVELAIDLPAGDSRSWLLVRSVAAGGGTGLKDVEVKGRRCWMTLPSDLQPLPGQARHFVRTRQELQSRLGECGVEELLHLHGLSREGLAELEPDQVPPWMLVRQPVEIVSGSSRLDVALALTYPATLRARAAIGELQAVLKRADRATAAAVDPHRLRFARLCRQHARDGKLGADFFESTFDGEPSDIWPVFPRPDERDHEHWNRFRGHASLPSMRVPRSTGQVYWQVPLHEVLLTAAERRWHQEALEVLRHLDQVLKLPVETLTEELNRGLARSPRVLSLLQPAGDIPEDFEALFRSTCAHAGLLLAADCVETVSEVNHWLECLDRDTTWKKLLDETRRDRIERFLRGYLRVLAGAAAKPPAWLSRDPAVARRWATLVAGKMVSRGFLLRLDAFWQDQPDLQEHLSLLGRPLVSIRKKWQKEAHEAAQWVQRVAGSGGVLASEVVKHLERRTAEILEAIGVTLGRFRGDWQARLEQLIEALGRKLQKLQPTLAIDKLEKLREQVSGLRYWLVGVIDEIRRSKQVQRLSGGWETLLAGLERGQQMIVAHARRLTSWGFLQTRSLLRALRLMKYVAAFRKAIERETAGSHLAELLVSSQSPTPTQAARFFKVAVVLKLSLIVGRVLSDKERSELTAEEYHGIYQLTLSALELGLDQNRALTRLPKIAGRTLTPGILIRNAFFFGAVLLDVWVIGSELAKDNELQAVIRTAALGVEGLAFWAGVAGSGGLALTLVVAGISVSLLYSCYQLDDLEQALKDAIKGSEFGEEGGKEALIALGTDPTNPSPRALSSFCDGILSNRKIGSAKALEKISEARLRHYWRVRIAFLAAEAPPERYASAASAPRSLELRPVLLIEFPDVKCLIGRHSLQIRQVTSGAGGDRASLDLQIRGRAAGRSIEIRFAGTVGAEIQLDNTVSTTRATGGSRAVLALMQTHQVACEDPERFRFFEPSAVELGLEERFVLAFDLAGVRQRIGALEARFTFDYSTNVGRMELVNRSELVSRGEALKRELSFMVAEYAHVDLQPEVRDRNLILHPTRSDPRTWSVAY